MVDDGSADNTADIVGQFQSKALRLIRNDQNHGKGYTVRQAFYPRPASMFLFTDADPSAPIEEANKLLDVAINEGADVVIGLARPRPEVH